VRRRGDETFPKFAESFPESFAKILAKFHELKISKKHNTNCKAMKIFN